MVARLCHQDGWYRIGSRAPTPSAELVPVRKKYFIKVSRTGSRLITHTFFLDFTGLGLSSLK